MTENVLLTLEQVRDWERQREESAQKISEETSRHALLSKKIEAASMFIPNEASADEVRKVRMPGIPLVLPPNENQTSLIPSMVSDGISLVEAITRVLCTSGKPLTNAGIKRMLGGTGYDVEKLASSPNYFYTATRRIVAKGDAEKLPDGRYVFVNQNASEDKTTEPVSSEASKDRDLTNHGTQPSSLVKPWAGGGT